MSTDPPALGWKSQLICFDPMMGRIGLCCRIMTRHSEDKLLGEVWVRRSEPLSDGTPNWMRLHRLLIGLENIELMRVWLLSQTRIEPRVCGYRESMVHFRGAERFISRVRWGFWKEVGDISELERRYREIMAGRVGGRGVDKRLKFMPSRRF